MAELDCTPNIQSAITVGQEVLLTCQGDIPLMDASKLEMRLAPEEKYKVHLLEAQRVSSTQMLVKVTSYKPGNHQLKALQLVDAQNSFVLGDLNLNVQSVMNPTEPKEEPFGPTGPISLTLSWYYFAGLGLVLLLLGLILGMRYRQKRQMKKFLESIKHFETRTSPYIQFHQSLRKFLRQYNLEVVEVSASKNVELVAELNQIYRLFVSREFQVPALIWADRRTLRFISGQKMRNRELVLESLRTSLRELASLKKTNKQLKNQDVIKLVDVLRKNVDDLEQWKKKDQVTV